MKVFLDSNIYLRYFTPEHPAMYEECAALIGKIEEGAHQPYTSAIVVLECAYALRKLYAFLPKQVQDAVYSILSMRNVTIIETTDTRKAFDIHQKTGVKLSDCLIATQVPERVTIVTYDREFAKLPVHAKTPKAMLAS